MSRPSPPIWHQRPAAYSICSIWCRSPIRRIRTCTRFVSDKEGLKRELFARIQARGERATPALVEKELAALERAHAALNAINAVHAAGGTAHYFSVNLTDAEAVAEVIDQVRSAADALMCCCMLPAWSAATSCRTKTRGNLI